MSNLNDVTKTQLKKKIYALNQAISLMNDIHKEVQALFAKNTIGSAQIDECNIYQCEGCMKVIYCENHDITKNEECIGYPFNKDIEARSVYQITTECIVAIGEDVLGRKHEWIACSNCG